jgi:hypothetical protein
VWRAVAAGDDVRFAVRLLMDRSAAAQYKGDCLAKAYISTAPTAPGKDARLPLAHEDSGRPQGPGGTPQEGPPSPHARLSRGTWNSRATRGWCGAANSMPFIAQENAARVPTLLFFFAPTSCRRAVSASASRKRSAARSCAIASGGASARSCAAIVWRYPQDGTSSYTRRARQCVRRSQR